jgi:hypothetical protein
MNGGPYDGELHATLSTTNATFVLLLVYGGNRGSGFSLGVDENAVSPKMVMTMVPAMLRAIADGIEAEGLPSEQVS